jgi:hypothetical protein
MRASNAATPNAVAVNRATTLEDRRTRVVECLYWVAQTARLEPVIVAAYNELTGEGR